jgi:glutathione synthase/RimK-type ligase-like ATP-grasp enzyme
LNAFVLNRPESIRLAADKPKCRQTLRDAGLSVLKENESKFPVIGRPRKHKAGKDFWVCNNEQEVWEAILKGAAYFARYYPKQNEYRVHVAGERVLLMSVKEGDKTQLIWNKRRSNFNFRHLRRSVWLNDPLLRRIARNAKKAVKVIGLDFGAVDVMSDAGQGWNSFVISEINTAPSLSPLALEKYINYFKKSMREEDNG